MGFAVLPGQQGRGPYTREDIKAMDDHRFNDVGNVAQVHTADGEPRHGTPEREELTRRLVATILACPEFSPTVWQKLIE